MLKAILFDMDGTIVDTESIAIQVIEAFLRREGKIPREADMEVIIGRPWTPAIEILLQRVPLKKSAAEVEAEVIRDYRARLNEPGLEVAGVVEAIRALSSEFTLALVSGSYRKDIFHFLDLLKVRDQFPLVLGCEDYAEGKPSPMPYLKAMELLKLTPSECVVFEDSKAGVLSAQAAGVPVIGVCIAPDVPRKALLTEIKDFHQVSPAWLRALVTP